MSLLLPISLVGGLAVAVVAWLWLIVRASREGVGWGLGSLLVPPVGLLFALRHAQKAIGPLVLFVVGILAAAAPAFYTLAMPVEPGSAVVVGRGPGALVGGDRRPEERCGARVDGEPGAATCSSGARRWPRRRGSG